MSADDWRRHAESRRGQPAGWLERLHGAFGEPPKRLADVASAKGIVVTTGQQPGLFGGPLYALSKAISALALSDAIQEATGVPTAPVFWAATDDADFLEAAGTFASDADGLHEMAQTNAPAAGTPMAAAALGDVGALLATLQRACGSGAHAEFFDMCRRAYSGDRTVGAAYLQLLREVLEPLGVSVLDASHESLRTAARPFLMEAQAAATKVAEARANRVAAIRGLGFEPQVEDDRGLSVVFAIEKGIKRRLTATETAPPNAPLAANVLARPVLERELLPTVAYVAGPGEIAYFTQADAVAEALGRPRLSVVPRWSCTVVERFVERAMDRLGVEYAELRDTAAVEKRLARAAVPETVARSWARLNEQMQALLQELARSVQDTRLMPAPVIEGLQRSLTHKLGRADRRILAAVKRREDATRKDVAAASAALWPRGQRQERTLNFIPMLSRCGAELLDEMRAAAGDHARQLIGAKSAAGKG